MGGWCGVESNYSVSSHSEKKSRERESLTTLTQRKRVERESLTTSPIWTTFEDFFLRLLINFDDEDETGCTNYEYFVSELFKYNFEFSKIKMG